MNRPQHVEEVFDFMPFCIFSHMQILWACHVRPFVSTFLFNHRTDLTIFGGMVFEDMRTSAVLLFFPRKPCLVRIITGCIAPPLTGSILTFFFPFRLATYYLYIENAGFYY